VPLVLVPAPRRSSRRSRRRLSHPPGPQAFFLLGTDTVYPRTTNAILKSFVQAWRMFCGAPNVVTDDPMEATWIGFNLWKEAVALEGTVNVHEVRRALGGLRL
jgi:ABC-type branched-subunit amino acid transport system substrate-binding protein